MTNFGMGGQDHVEELEELGKRLSIEIQCEISYPFRAKGETKNGFGCRCGIFIPMYQVKAGMWKEIQELHKH